MSRDFAFRATPPGEGGIHLVWLVGPQAEAIAGRIFRGKGPLGERARVGTLEWEGETLDEAVVRRLVPGESPFAGPLVEISVHGSMAVVERLLDALAASGAERIETRNFFRLARETGGIDRCQEEAWEALLDARGERASRLLLAQAEGALSREIRALLGEIPAAEAARNLGELLARARAGLALARPPRLAIAGPPNAGKSTLLNALLGFERALVAPVPGTTRDPVREFASLGGYPFRLADTAGIRPPADDLEGLGVAAAEDEIRDADLVLFVWDGSAPWGRAEGELVRRVAARPSVGLRNKSDLGFPEPPPRLPFPFVEGSLRDAAEETLRALSPLVLERMGLPVSAPTDRPCPFTARQVSLFERARRLAERGADFREPLRELLSG